MWAAPRESWKSLRAFPSPLTLHHRFPYSFFRKARSKGEGKEKMRRFGWLSLEKNKLFSAFRRERSTVRGEKIRSRTGKIGQFFLFVVFSAGERRGRSRGIPRWTGEFLRLGGEKSCRSSLCQEGRRGCGQDFQGKTRGERTFPQEVEGKVGEGGGTKKGARRLTRSLCLEFRKR